MSTARNALLIVAGVAVAVALAVLPSTFVRSSAATAPGSGTTKAEVEQIVHNYLLEHPEMLQEMASALQMKQQHEADLQRSSVFTEDHDALFDSPLQVTLGNPKGDVTLVEFFDYNCTYCRHALEDTNALLKSDPKLRFVLKEFPVLSQASKEAAEVAVAVNRIAPEKYLAFHRALLGSDAEATGASAMAVATGLGIDKAALAKELASPTIDRPIRQSLQLARALSINGTPTYVIGQTVLPGAVGLDALKTAVANMRTCGKAICS